MLIEYLILINDCNFKNIQLLDVFFQIWFVKIESAKISVMQAFLNAYTVWLFIFRCVSIFSKWNKILLKKYVILCMYLCCI